MKYLKFILDNILDSMVELEAILAEEVNQLSRSQINPVSLQIVSDIKSKLLATIGHYDKLRKEKESSLQLAAPYHEHVQFNAQWEKITARVKQANTLNQNVYGLLEVHMQKSNNIKDLVTKAGVDNKLYGSSGQSDTPTSGRIYNISI